MKKTTKLLALLLALAMMLSVFTACGGGNDSKTTESTEATAESTENANIEQEGGNAVNNEAVGEEILRDVVNVGISADPGDLSPWGPENTGRTAMANQIYQSLAHEIDGEIVGVLMSDYELAEDESYPIQFLPESLLHCVWQYQVSHLLPQSLLHIRSYTDDETLGEEQGCDVFPRCTSGTGAVGSICSLDCALRL